VAIFGGKVYSSLETLLADDDVNLVVNLTTQSAHVDIIRQCLQAGKHVYSEKPLAWGRLESWHPAPGPFYEVGPLFDVAVYLLTILTTNFCIKWL
jgi:hypothetical protein